MAVICRRHRLLFLMSPWTGGRRIAHALVAHAGGEQIPPAGSAVPRFGLARHHTTLPALFEFNLLTLNEYSDLLLFTGIRNPFDAVVATYKKFMKWVRAGQSPRWLTEASQRLLAEMHRRDLTFREFVELDLCDRRDDVTANLRWTMWSTGTIGSRRSSRGCHRSSRRWG